VVPLENPNIIVKADIDIYLDVMAVILHMIEEREKACTPS